MERIIQIFCVFAFITSIIMTIKLRFPQFRVHKRLKKHLNKSSYRTLLFTLASHIGTGNIVGMVTGIMLGGVGVIFWLWVFSFFSSSFALVENTYGQVFKEQIGLENRGSASFYLHKGLGLKFISHLFMFLMVINSAFFFPPLQINAMVVASNNSLGDYRYLLGIIILAIIMMIIIRGTKSMVSLMEKLVPIMAILYIAIVLGIILGEFNKLPSVLCLIVKEAFSFRALGVGAIVSQFTLGIRRGLFSNEAGLGTTPSISAMATVDNPTTTGYVQMQGVYIDSLIMCTLTGILIVISGIDLTNFGGSDVFVTIFNQYLGRFGSVLAIALLYSFAFSSIIGGYYMGESNILYLGASRKIKPIKLIRLFRILFIGGQLLGIFLTTFTVLQLVDVGLALLGTINIIALFVLEKKYKIVKNY